MNFELSHGDILLLKIIIDGIDLREALGRIKAELSANEDCIEFKNFETCFYNLYTKFNDIDIRNLNFGDTI